MSKFIGTTIPNSGFVGTIYCNTNESYKRVNSVLSRVTYVANPFLSDPIYPILVSASGQPVIFAMKDNDYYEITLVHNLQTGSFEYIYQYDPTGLDGSGWKKDIIEINTNVVDSFSGLAVGSNNDLLNGILSISEFSTPPLKSVLKDIANAIREKNDSEGLIKTIEMSDSILDLPGKISLNYKKDVVGVKINKDLNEETIYNKLSSLTFTPDSDLSEKYFGIPIYSYLIIWGEINQNEPGNYCWLRAFKINKDNIGAGRDLYGLVLSFVLPDEDEDVILYSSDSTSPCITWKGWQDFWSNIIENGLVFVGNVHIGKENDKLIDFVSLVGGTEENTAISIPNKLSGNSLVISEPHARIDIKEMINNGNLPLEVITNMTEHKINYSIVTAINLVTGYPISVSHFERLNYNNDNLFIIFETDQGRSLDIIRHNVNNKWVYCLRYNDRGSTTIVYSSDNISSLGITAGWNSSVGDMIKLEKLDEEIFTINQQYANLDSFLSLVFTKETIPLNKTYFGIDTTITSNQTINIKDWFNTEAIPTHIKVNVESSGGGSGSSGIIEVDKLPPITSGGTTVPNQGTINRIYCNTSLSNKEIDALLRPILSEPMFEESPVYFVAFCVSGDSQYMLAAGMMDGNNIAIVAINGNGENILYNPQDGWSPEFPGYIELGDNWELIPEQGAGTYNESLSSLFSTTPFKHNIEDGTIAKLPDGTLGIVQNGQWKLLTEKLSPTYFGAYNNPDFGFYVGQTFGFDDTISFDVSTVLSKMTENGMSDFAAINTLSPFIIYIPTVNSYISGVIAVDKLLVDFHNLQGVTSISIHTDNPYSDISKTYQVGVNDIFTFTLRQLYQECYSNNTSKLDTILKGSPMQYGYIAPQEGVLSSYDLNSSENAFYKFLKIGK